MRRRSSGDSTLRALKLPEELREVLSKGPEDVVKGEDPEATMREVLERLRDCSKLIAVGDLVCYSLIAHNVTPDICVIDGKTKRTYEVPEISEKCFSKVLETWNPPGHITDGSVRVLRKAVNSLRNNQKVLVKVSGEEDLLALPLIMHSPEEGCVIMGIPSVGVGYVRVNRETRKRVRETLSKFSEVYLK